jgi:hypothetical protein
MEGCGPAPQPCGRAGRSALKPWLCDRSALSTFYSYSKWTKVWIEIALNRENQSTRLLTHDPYNTTMARRTPLMPLDLNRIRNQELSSWLRVRFKPGLRLASEMPRLRERPFWLPQPVNRSFNVINNATRISHFLAPAVLTNCPLVTRETF